MYMKAAVDEKGKPTAWLQRSVYPPIGSTFNLNAEYSDGGELGLGWIDLPFDLPNHRAENVRRRTFALAGSARLPIFIMPSRPILLRMSSPTLLGGTPWNICWSWSVRRGS